ncbi:MAG: post-COAP-1 domain-containing protein [Candidatus Bathyarchaeia archaeon]
MVSVRSAFSSATSITLTGLGEGSHTFEVKAKDQAENEDPTPASQTFSVDITPPTLSKTLTGTEGLNGWWVSDVTVTLTASDEVSGVASVEYSFDGQNWIEYSGPFTISDEGTTTLYHRATDNAGNVYELPSQEIKIDKTAPVIRTDVADCGVYPAPFTLRFSASDEVSGVASITASLKDSFGTRTVSSGESLGAGVYTLSITAVDNAGNNATFEVFFVVYDPSAGFVTGGGWINSPAGAYKLDPSLSGKATFGFVSKYQKGANVPTGNTEFQFHAAGLNFKSTSYEWLVVAGSKATFKGSGTLNGVGGYKFMLWAGDGGKTGLDTFRIKIWTEVNGVEIVIYDNGFDQTIAGGSIVIHK